MAGDLKVTIGAVDSAAPREPNPRWTGRQEREVALRLLRGEPENLRARKRGVAIYQQGKLRNERLVSIDARLRERDGLGLNNNGVALD